MNVYGQLVKAQLEQLASDPGTPVIGQAWFNTTEKAAKFYDGVVVKEMGGGGSGSTGVNYLANTDFNSTVDNWTGDTNLVISQETGSPLRGNGSLKIAKGAINASTQVVYSDTFTVDAADLASVMVIKFEYDFSDANYADGHARVEVQADPAGTPSIIRVNGEDIMAGKGTHYARFQTDATIATYRVRIYWVNTGTNAVNCYIDDITCGPQVINHGAIITDWETFTGTTLNNFGNATLTHQRVRRVGDSAQFDIRIEIGATPPTSTLQIVLPSTYSIDSTKLLSGNYLPLGTVTGGGTSGNLHIGKPYLASGNTINFAGDDGATLWNATVPLTWSSGSADRIYVSFQVPIAGWGGTTKMSEDFSGKEVVTEVVETISQALTDNTITKVALTSGATVVSNTSGAWDTSNLRINILETGYYDIHGSLAFGTGADDDGNGGVYIYKNGVYLDGNLVGLSIGNTNTIPYTKPAVFLQKGDYLELYAYWLDVVASTTVTLTQARFSVAKRSSPQTMLENELVAASYSTDAGQSIIDLTDVEVIYEDLAFDTHNAYNTSTGDYTVPTSGKYLISASVIYNSVHNAGEYVTVGIRVNGTKLKETFVEANTNDSSNTIRNPQATLVADLVKGDIVDVITFQNVFDPSIPLNVTARGNTFSITRIK